MDQEKIGKFIAQLRKEKNMTQKELADKLGITDRAISKWENGRGLPDLSIITTLSQELNISINELLSGERINQNEYQRKLEESIINTIDYSNEKIKTSQKHLSIILLTTGLIIVTILSMFLIDTNRMRNNKPVIFSTWGFKYQPAYDLHEEEIFPAIKEYLVNQSNNESKLHNNEKTFISMRVYLIEEEKKDSLYYIYTLVLQEDYYLENDVIKKDSSSVISYKFEAKNINDIYVVTDSITPRDGSYYSDDMNAIFPASVRNEMNECYNDGTIKKLEVETEEKVKLYFNK